jgi:hypothetical protein
MDRKGTAAMDSFEGRATSIMGDIVHVSDVRGVHSVFLARERIDGHEALALDDRLWVEGEPSRRRARRLGDQEAAPADR